MIDQDTWFKWIRRGAAGMGITCLCLLTVYNTFRLRAVYAHAQEIAAMQIELTSLSMTHDTEMRAASARIDEIERVLFGNVVAKIDKPPNNQVQLWQKNRDQELRERIQRLERWRAMWGEP